jgi:DNA-binding transcriptional ArsR family regulator
MDDVRTATPSPHQLRALAHPVRLRMLGMLRIDGPATATALATRLGLNTGATSYHLRQLASHGFIEDDESQGNRRERWWKAAHSSTRTASPAPDDDEGWQETDAYLQTVATVYTEWLQRAMEERPLLPPSWRDVGTLSDWHPRLTPATATRLFDQLDELLSSVEDEDDPEARHVVFQVSGYVRPGQVAGDDVPGDAGGDESP